MAAEARKGDGGSPFWSRTSETVLIELGSRTAGLGAWEVESRRERWGPNVARPPERHPALRLLARQLRGPIVILLGLTAILSAFVGEVVDASIILAILVGSGLLGFWQEWRAALVVRELLDLIRTTVRVRRDGAETEVPLEDIVPGDIVVLAAGDLVPADCRLLQARDVDVDESALTGESFPVSKATEPVRSDAPLAERSSALFQGTHVISGTATAVVVRTGGNTLFGSLAEEIERRRPESEFEHGVRRFGYLLLEITLLLVLVVFAINVALDRPVLDVFLFSLALAVGLTPQLLPAIVSITLSTGARHMARREVVVRRLVSIEDFGGMQILCTDKTGTLTEGRVRVNAALDVHGEESRAVRRLAWLNASLQSGFANPVDLALREETGQDAAGCSKLDEVPYDFVRRRLSVLLEQPDGSRLLVTKGAVAEVLAVCDRPDTRPGEADSPDWRESVRSRVADLCADGLRCLAVAFRPMDGARSAGRDDEQNMVFAGILALSDPVKSDAAAALAHLGSLGIALKMITGDNRAVAASVARAVGLSTRRVVTGEDVSRLTDRALRRRVQFVDVFAEMDPNQKERVILALRGGGVSVGYLGDGINDAAALHAADVGISVDTAVDVTRRAADVVLLRKDLEVLAAGVEEGRRAFANTLKYVFVTTSANFGNMFSMAGASLLAAFLPMLPKQILLLNLLSDLPAMAIATDRLDPEQVARPRRWDVAFIRDYMVTFGLVSSLFDFLTFAILVLLAVPAAPFRTAWFIESVLSEIFVLLVIRTARRFYRSLPSAPLLAATVAVAAITLALPYLPGAALLGFAPLPAPLMAAMLIVTVLLVLTSELAKGFFFGRHSLGSAPADRSIRRPAAGPVRAAISRPQRI